MSSFKDAFEKKKIEIMKNMQRKLEHLIYYGDDDQNSMPKSPTIIKLDDFIYNFNDDNDSPIDWSIDGLEYLIPEGVVLKDMRKEKQCPDCKINWTISHSPVSNEKWRDCGKCKKRYEDFK